MSLTLSGVRARDLTAPGFTPAIDPDEPTPQALDLASLLPLLRASLFVGVLSLAWITLHPFQSLGSEAALELSSGNETTTYIAFALLAAAALALSGPRLAFLVDCLRSRPALFMGLWLVVTSVVSQDPSTSVKRLVLTAMVATVAACLFLMPRDQRELARFLAIAVGLVVVLSYAGVILAPQLSIHQATDAGEPQLAGAWRGVFGHKNGAAAAFSIFVFFGLFIARSGYLRSGIAIVVASAVFLLNADGKSSLMLVVIAFLVARVWERTESRGLRIALALAPLVVLLTAGLGSVLIAPVGALVRSLPFDSTFTGRTDVWAFAAGKLQGHLTTGFGFQAFWNTAATRETTHEDGWAGIAAHAHNGYLDMVVNMGLPGLAFMLLLFVVQPVRDVFAAEERGTDPALLSMLTSVWLFGLYLSAMETFLFNRDDPTWIAFLFAVFGLRYAACHPLRGQPRLHLDGAA